ncbi:TPA: hypothetical protein F6W26_05430 [Citrobacter amalonaticus]|uniref:Uncharacterized protein n=1 Tax=Citrobacter amalonaticus TaxID=35703 RepID=A0ABY0HTD5_CITAM|nr:hypothetical protein C2U53_17625 [Citrobacter sp. CFNIH10]AVC45297.1 hypothetical protein AL524_25320 [Citrobacter amalonaticus]QDK85349.1 hypothetical protein FEO47_07605 [Citrobacter amalonaticus]RSC59010.1 hypothetical protein EGW07_15815 [Citrobacter amalonaticus]RYT42052.1 hypothetical protein EAJ18_17045 [Citrobacter amalonaticus]
MSLRDTLRLFLQATGPGTTQHPCFARPEPASLRVLPALRKRVGNFQPDLSIPDHLHGLLFFTAK